MAVWRMRAPSVRQTENTCWAAAISSWSRVTGGIHNWMRVNDVINEFNSWTPSYVLAGQDLETPKGWIEFADRYDLEIEEILIQQPKILPDGRVIFRTPTPSGGVSHVRTRDLSLTHFSGKLRSSHVIVVLPPVNQVDPAHTVVVYGADSKRVYYMDPNARWEADALRERARYENFGQGGAGSERYLLIWKAH